MRQLKETAVREKEQTDKALATERQEHAQLRATHDQLVAYHEAAGGTSGNGTALAEAQQTIKALKEDVETMKGVSANLVGQKRKLAEDYMAAAVEAEAFRRAIVQFPFDPDETENHQKRFALLQLAAKTVEEHNDELVEWVQSKQREAAEAAEAGGASSAAAPPPAKKKKKKAPAAAAAGSA
jgi:DNA repair ATPase RecN